MEASIVISTYQASRLLFLGCKGSEVYQYGIPFKKPMGVALKDDRSIAVATLNDLQVFHNVPEFLKHNKLLDQGYDALYCPSARYRTGILDIHDIAFGKNNAIWGVNTAFSC